MRLLYSHVRIPKRSAWQTPGSREFAVRNAGRGYSEDAMGVTLQRPKFVPRWSADPAGCVAQQNSGHGNVSASENGAPLASLAETMGFSR